MFARAAMEIATAKKGVIASQKTARKCARAAQTCQQANAVNNQIDLSLI